MKMYKLFLSYSKPINKQQITILNYIKRTLNKLNICIVEVQNEVLDKSPIFKINNALKQCDFFLCIAYEKDQYMDQNGEYYYTTSVWLDIEIALAIAHNLPFFVIKESKIKDTALLNSIDPIKYYILPNAKNNTLDFEYLKSNIMPLLIKQLNI